MRSALSDAYRRATPELVPDFPMHPDSEPARLTGDWPAEIETSRTFSAAVVQERPWSEAYRASDYAALLQTHQDHILLEPDRRSELLDAITAAIDRSGGTFDLPFVTYVCLARHEPRPGRRRRR